MRGRFWIVLGAAVAAVSVSAVVPAGAAKPVVTATGDVRCTGILKLRGTVTRIPLLTPQSDGSTVRISANGKLGCAGATGNPGVSVGVAKVSGTYVSAPRVCFVQHPVIGVQAPGWRFSLKWKASGGRLQSTTVVFSNVQGINKDPWVQRYFAQLVMPASAGTSTVYGSYAGSGTASLRMWTWANTLGWLDGRCGDSVSDRAEMVTTLDL